MPKKRANGEGSLRKRKDGRWEGRYTAGNDPATGKPIHKSVLAKTQAEAKEKLKQAIAEAEKLDMSRAKSYTLGAWTAWACGWALASLQGQRSPALLRSAPRISGLSPA